MLTIPNPQTYYFGNTVYSGTSSSGSWTAPQYNVPYVWRPPLVKIITPLYWVHEEQSLENDLWDISILAYGLTHNGAGRLRIGNGMYRSLIAVDDLDMDDTRTCRKERGVDYENI